MIASLSEIIVESLGSDISLLWSKIKLLERKDICLPFVVDLYSKFYSCAEKLNIHFIIHLHKCTTNRYPRTQKLIFDSLLNSVSKKFISSENSMNLDNCQVLNCAVIDDLMNFPKLQFYKLIKAILISRDLAFFEKDCRLIWNRYLFLGDFIKCIYRQRLIENVCHLQYGIYFKYMNNAMDIVSYCIQDEDTLNHLEEQYSHSDYIIQDYRHNSINLSEENRQKMWIAALKNACFIDIKENYYSIYAGDEEISITFIISSPHHCGKYKMFSKFSPSIEAVQSVVF